MECPSLRAESTDILALALTRIVLIEERVIDIAKYRLMEGAGSSFVLFVVVRLLCLIVFDCVVS